MVTEFTLRFAGLKYHDMIVNVRSSIGGSISMTGCPTAMCENMAPDIEKKNPA
jgi:hypothetical protein